MTLQMPTVAVASGLQQMEELLSEWAQLTGRELSEDTGNERKVEGRKDGKESALTTHALTDAALQRSEKLLADLRSLDLCGETSNEPDSSAGPQELGTAQLEADVGEPQMSWRPEASSTQDRPETVEVPAVFVDMLVQMWDQLKTLRAQAPTDAKAAPDGVSGQRTNEQPPTRRVSVATQATALQPKKALDLGSTASTASDASPLDPCGSRSSIISLTPSQPASPKPTSVPMSPALETSETGPTLETSETTETLLLPLSRSQTPSSPMRQRSAGSTAESVGSARLASPRPQVNCAPAPLAMGSAQLPVPLRQDAAAAAAARGPRGVRCAPVGRGHFMQVMTSSQRILQQTMVITDTVIPDASQS